MEDSVIVRFPRRDWALSAVQELRREGCRAELIEPYPGDTSWGLLVSGPAEAIEVLRAETRPCLSDVCWETFVNETLAGAVPLPDVRGDWLV